MDRLDPKQRLAVEFYTNPLYGRTFGNKTASGLAAGYKSGYAAHCLDGAASKEAIAWMMEHRDDDAQHVAKYLERFSMDAAKKLVAQMGADDGIAPHAMPEGLLDKPATPIIGTDKDGAEKVIGWDDGHLKQAKEITGHNKAAASLMREVRESLKLILAYQLGTPEQKVSVEHTKGKADPLDLGSLEDEQLRELARHIDEVRAMNDGEAPPPMEDEAPVLDAELLDDDVEEEAP